MQFGACSLSALPFFKGVYQFSLSCTLPSCYRLCGIWIITPSRGYWGTFVVSRVIVHLAERPMLRAFYFIWVHKMVYGTRYWMHRTCTTSFFLGQHIVYRDNKEHNKWRHGSWTCKNMLVLKTVVGRFPAVGVHTYVFLRIYRCKCGIKEAMWVCAIVFKRCSQIKHDICTWNCFK